MRKIIPIAGIVVILAVGIIIGVVIGKNSGKSENDNTNRIVQGNDTKDSDTAKQNTEVISQTETSNENNSQSTETVTDNSQNEDITDIDNTDNDDPELIDNEKDVTAENKEEIDDSDIDKGNDIVEKSEEKDNKDTGDGKKGNDNITDTDTDDKKTDNEEKKEDEKKSDTEEDKKTGDDAEYILTYSVDNSWQDGNVNMFGLQIALTNNSSKAINGWKLVLEVSGLSQVTGWNGNFTTSKETLSVTDAGYNSDIYAGGTIVIGCNLGTTSKNIKIKDAKINGKSMTVKSGKVDQNDPGLHNEDDGGSDDGGSDDDRTPDGGENDDDGDDETEVHNIKGAKGDDWLYTDGKNILDKDGKKVWLTGVNWFGYNTGTNTFDGLWNSKLVPTVKAIADHGFNLIRVPISAELINQWSKGEYPRANYNNAYNPELNSMNSLEIFDYFLSLAEEYGIKVMPDIHSAETNASGHNVNLWYTDRVKVSDYYHALEWMAARYADNDTIIAFDLKNEPHGKPYEGDGAAIWNDSKSANNWKYVAETAAAKVLNKNPNVLIMIEGIEIYPIDIKSNSDYHSKNDKDYYFNWWGGNLRGVADYPINLGKHQNKLVYSPHDYGPTVYEQPWFEGKYNYDSLMKDCWHDNWFFIYEKNIAPLLIGEWGGFMREPNLTWMTYMRQLIKKYHLNHTFWCLNANSGDTGGLLLDDFTTWDTEKYNFVKEVLWQENGKFVGLDHVIPLGKNGISVKDAKGIS
ncbi:MAG: cellulase family glycosylhydrolase [Lachnospiraceae bacterium]|nr:cellulase family glycosylhydrolase [Lachnospiraceae bacterium]